MLRKKITYVDYNGVSRTEDFYFNLTQSEITEMQLSVNGGIQQMLRRIIDSQDSKRIIEVFKEIILKSYGEKSDDGRRFIKSKEISEAFSQTPAFDQLFMELATDADAGAAFINGIIPLNDEQRKEFDKEMAKLKKEGENKVVQLPEIE